MNNWKERNSWVLEFKIQMSMRRAPLGFSSLVSSAWLGIQMTVNNQYNRSGYFISYSSNDHHHYCYACEIPTHLDARIAYRFRRCLNELDIRKSARCQACWRTWYFKALRAAKRVSGIGTDGIYPINLILFGQSDWVEGWAQLRVYCPVHVVYVPKRVP